jgi:tetratricopeptide (TPR) repeat protein
MDLRQKVHQASIGLLNLSGLGLGYLCIRHWVRWVLNLLGTIGLLLALFFMPISQYLPLMIWSIFFAVWLLWMALDGWRLARKRYRKNELPQTKFIRFLLAIAVILIGLEAGVCLLFQIVGKSFYNDGVVAYQNSDYHLATKKLKQVTDFYPFFFSGNIQEADSYLKESTLFILGEKHLQSGDYENAMKVYDTYSALYPESMKIQEVDTLKLKVIRDWASELINKGMRDQALNLYFSALEENSEISTKKMIQDEIVNIYEEIAESYRQEGDRETAISYYELILDVSGGASLATNKIAEILAELAEDYLMEEKYEETITQYQYIFDNFPNTPAGNLAEGKISEVYIIWAAMLRKGKIFDTALEKYYIVLNKYPDTISAEVAQEEIPIIIFESGEYYFENGDIDQAIEKYTSIIEDYPENVLVGEAQNRIILCDHVLAKQLLEKGAFLPAMNKFISLADIADDEELLAEYERGYQEALVGLSKDSGTDGAQILTSAFRLACDHKPAVSQLVGLLADEQARGLDCDENTFLNKGQTAIYPGHFRFVTKTVIHYTTVETCPFENNFTLIRRKETWDVSVYSSVSGKLFSAKTFIGGEPEPCPEYYWFTDSVNFVDGAAPSFTQVSTWIDSKASGLPVSNGISPFTLP